MRSLLSFILAILILAPGGIAIVDVNSNGLSDFWERQYNDGELFPETFDPQADSDGDGWTNAREAAAGTDPREGNPPDGIVLARIAHVPAVMGADEWGTYVISPAAFTVSWPTISGKRYVLQFSPDMSAGGWLPVGGPFVGNGGATEYTFIFPNAERFFWRVAIDDTDTDGDGLTDYEERQIGSSPHNADSDGDGLGDSEEIALGHKR